jgi:SPP1 gp7 family putative phage head morphogenesis protein
MTTPIRVVRVQQKTATPEEQEGLRRAQEIAFGHGVGSALLDIEAAVHEAHLAALGWDLLEAAEQRHLIAGILRVTPTATAVEVAQSIKGALQGTNRFRGFLPSTFLHRKTGVMLVPQPSALDLGKLARATATVAAGGEAALPAQDVIRRYTLENTSALQQFGNQMQQQVVGLLQQGFRNVQAEVVQRFGAGTMTPAMANRLTGFTQRAAQMLDSTYKNIAKDMAKQMAGLAVVESGYAEKLLQTVAGLATVEMRTTRLTQAQIKAIVDFPVHGAKAGEWWEKQGADAAFAVRNQVQQGLLRGETTQQIMQRLQQTEDISRRKAQLLTRTSVTAVQNQAQFEVLAAQGKDVTAEYEYVATLDARTSPQCRALDGQRFSYDDPKAPRPPLHPNCRSTIVPVVNWDALLGEATDVTQLAPTTRAAMGGPTSAKTYSDWLKQQPAAIQNSILGPTRGALFRSGKASLADLIGTDGRQLTLKQLEAKLGTLPTARPAAVPATPAVETPVVAAVVTPVEVAEAQEFESVLAEKLATRADYELTFDAKEWTDLSVPARREKFLGKSVAARKAMADPLNSIDAAGDSFRGRVRKALEIMATDTTAAYPEEMLQSWDRWEGVRRTGEVPLKGGRSAPATLMWLDNALGRRVDAYEAAGFIGNRARNAIKDFTLSTVSKMRSLGLSEGLIARYTVEQTDALLVQEAEAVARSLGDHGIRHLQGDYDLARSILDEQSGTFAHAAKLPFGKEPLAPHEDMVLRTAASFHDIGYLTPTARIFLDDGHPDWGAVYFEENVLPRLKSSAQGGTDLRFLEWLGGQAPTMMRTHDSPIIDWGLGRNIGVPGGRALWEFVSDAREKSLLSAFRVADNMQLWQKEKLPAFMEFLGVPGREVVERLAAGQLTEEQARDRLHQMVATRAAELDTPVGYMHRLNLAIDEVTTVFPKFIDGMYDGAFREVSWDGDVVAFTFDRFKVTRLPQVAQLGYKQWVKMAETYGLSEEAALTMLKNDYAALRDPATGKIIMEFDIRTIEPSAIAEAVGGQVPEPTGPPVIPPARALTEPFVADDAVNLPTPQWANRRQLPDNIKSLDDLLTNVKALKIQTPVDFVESVLSLPGTPSNIETVRFNVREPGWNPFTGGTLAWYNPMERSMNFTPQSTRAIKRLVTFGEKSDDVWGGVSLTMHEINHSRNPVGVGGDPGPLLGGDPMKDWGTWWEEGANHYKTLTEVNPAFGHPPLWQPEYPAAYLHETQAMADVVSLGVNLDEFRSLPTTVERIAMINRTAREELSTLLDTKLKEEIPDILDRFEKLAAGPMQAFQRRVSPPPPGDNAREGEAFQKVYANILRVQQNEQLLRDASEAWHFLLQVRPLAWWRSATAEGMRAALDHAFQGAVTY